MAATSEPTRRDTTLNIRSNRRDVDLIDRAAELTGKTRSAFVLESARQSAQDVLLDRTVFGLNEGAFQRFVDILDNPPPPNDKLKMLMSTPAPWER